MRTIAVLLFLTVCAYIGAGFYEDLNLQVQAVRAESADIIESTQLFGIAVRREQQLCSPLAVSMPENGKRYAAGETLCVLKDGSSLISPAPGIFFSETDGFEYLSADALFPFSAELFSSMINSQAEKNRHCLGRLVFDNVWYFAAQVKSGSAPEIGQLCRLYFPDIESECQALVWDVCQSEGQEFVLLRINGGDEKLSSLRRSKAELIRKEYSGIVIPKEAIVSDGEEKFVNVLIDGLVETRTVDIIFSDYDFCLAERSYSRDALREGEMIVLQTDNLDEGRVFG